MKKLSLALCAMFILSANVSFAEETIGDKASNFVKKTDEIIQNVASDAGKGIESAINSGKEKLEEETDVKAKAEEAAEEKKDETVKKAEEKVDDAKNEAKSKVDKDVDEAKSKLKSKLKW